MTRPFALLHFAASVSAFQPHITPGVLAHSCHAHSCHPSFPRSRAVPALRSNNEFDVWWAERRVRNRVGGAPGAQTHVLDALPLDVPSLTLVLEEFVESDYASQVCSCCNLQPTDYGAISGMCADHTESIHHAHITRTPCAHRAHHAHTTRTPRTHHAHTMRTPCAHHAHTMRTPCAHHAHTTRTPCAHHAHTMRTPCQVRVCAANGRQGRREAEADAQPGAWA